MVTADVAMISRLLANTDDGSIDLGPVPAGFKVTPEWVRERLVALYEQLPPLPTLTLSVGRHTGEGPDQIRAYVTSAGT